MLRSFERWNVGRRRLLAWYGFVDWLEFEWYVGIDFASPRTIVGAF